jgi:hypothetical protein
MKKFKVRQRSKATRHKPGDDLAAVSKTTLGATLRGVHLTPAIVDLGEGRVQLLVINPASAKVEWAGEFESWAVLLEAMQSESKQVFREWATKYNVSGPELFLVMTEALERLEGAQALTDSITQARGV